ncbi:hypothetical protein SARC_09843 [Sphaeroforma arctica JP610]|uniref:EGF-like domain-containing protein n=1 Tax=Sphaeroforma arctica JP610 TaxID=667725 RepID=A0A0L0FMI3_9EUKA|nr:hypothetical protein SARC_09843 [Sphaeroforma arctica JP610]KNC77701.1 hypothetical protein SARC_09843 [Sphaeroforma arctica JP610]|eukprot:XP_014151603.1 hypothetical protein SARC_09843 [Sphaeroforma arctica JP610]
MVKLEPGESHSKHTEKTQRCTKKIKIASCILAILVLIGIIVGVLAATGTLSGSNSDGTAQGSKTIPSVQPSTIPVPSTTPPALTLQQIAEMKPRNEVLQNLTVSWSEWKAQCGDGVCGEGGLPEQVVFADTDCESNETYIPNGWKVADNNQDTKQVAATYSFAAPCLVLRDGTVLATKGVNASDCHPIPLSVTTHSDRRTSVKFAAELCPARILIEQIDSVIQAPGFVPKSCPASCSGHGTCDPITGKCICDNRFTGTSCSRVIGDISIPTNSETVDRYKPKKGIRWQWQLQDTIDESHDVPLYDIDFDTPDSTIASLHAAGRRVMCYFSAGSTEKWRIDQELFPAFIQGGPLLFGTGDVFDDEAWLDLRRFDIIGPIMMNRLDAAKAKGCDAVEFDNPDIVIHEHGLAGNIDLTLQLQFDKWCVRQAHARGMSVALKNSNEFAFLLSDTYDMVVNEEAFINGNIDNYWPFLHRDKPVLNTEYFTSRCFYCATSRAMGVSTIKKRPDLDSCLVDCTMEMPLNVTSVCDSIGFEASGRARYPASAEGWCPLTLNLDANECAAPRFAECDPSYGY